MIYSSKASSFYANITEICSNSIHWLFLQKEILISQFKYRPLQKLVSVLLKYGYFNTFKLKLLETVGNSRDVAPLRKK